jgi:hypothetical protein
MVDIAPGVVITMAVFDESKSEDAPIDPVKISDIPMPDGKVDEWYSHFCEATGGTIVKHWTAVGLPAGLSINQSTGQISGWPAAFGHFSAAVSVSDSTGADTKSFQFDVTAELVLQDTSLPKAFIGREYTHALSPFGGYPPYISTGTGFPTGVGVVGNTIHGIPGEAGQFDVEIIVRDSMATEITKSFSLKVVEELLTVPLTLPVYTIGDAVAAQLSATGGTPPYIWSATGIPSGLSVSQSGAITGTIIEVGDWSMRALCTDSDGATATRIVRIISADMSNPPLITTGALVPAVVGRSYTQKLSATGGSPPYAWSATGLPAGMYVESSGRIMGTSSKTGDFNIHVVCTDSANATAEADYILSSSSDMLILTDNIPDMRVNRAITEVQFTKSGGNSPFNWSITSGPDGLAMTNLGLMGGAPKRDGDYVLTVRLTDCYGVYVEKSWQITVAL